jgi:hypothetical protein
MGTDQVYLAKTKASGFFVRMLVTKFGDYISRCSVIFGINVIIFNSGHHLSDTMCNISKLQHEELQYI